VIGSLMVGGSVVGCSLLFDGKKEKQSTSGLESSNAKSVEPMHLTRPRTSSPSERVNAKAIVAAARPVVVNPNATTVQTNKTPLVRRGTKPLPGRVLE